MLVTTGNLQDGLANAMKSLAIMEPLAKADPKKFEILDELQNAYELIGDIQGGNGLSANLGDTTAALENHRKALAMAQDILRDRPDDPHARRGVAIYNIKVADDLVKLGDRVTAQENYSKALDTYTSLAAGSVNANLTRELNLVYTRIGDIQLMDGNSRAAKQSYRTAMDIAEKLALVDPQNALAREDLATGYAMLGKAAAESGGPKEGLAFLQKAIGLMETEVAHDPKRADSRRILGLLYIWKGQILADSGSPDAALTEHKKTEAILAQMTSADPNDVEARLTLAATRTKIADVLVGKGRTAAARALYGSVLPVVESFALSTPPNMQAQYTLADTYSGMGDAWRRQASGKATSAKQIEYWTQARSWYERSFAVWRQVRNPGRLSPSGFDTAGPGAVAEKLEQGAAALGKLKAAAR
jgi:tetratricopeptide (TPR) repeat protein